MNKQKWVKMESAETIFTRSRLSTNPCMYPVKGSGSCIVHVGRAATDKAIRGQVFISTFPIAKSRAICHGKEKGWLPPSPLPTFFPTSLYPLYKLIRRWGNFPSRHRHPFEPLFKWLIMSISCIIVWDTAATFMENLGTTAVKPIRLPCFFGTLSCCFPYRQYEF